MTLAQYLIVPLVVLVAMDLRLTLIGLSRGYEEHNPLVAALMAKLGQRDGLALGVLLINFPALAVVFFFPDQWLVIVADMIHSADAIYFNWKLLRRPQWVG